MRISWVSTRVKVNKHFENVWKRENGSNLRPYASIGSGFELKRQILVESAMKILLMSLTFEKDDSIKKTSE